MTFDWRSRITWIGRTDSGVVRQRLYDRDIRILLLSPLDPGRKTWDAAIRKEAAQTGRYIDPHWYGLAGDGSALAFRKVVDQACLELQPGELVMLDLEQVSGEYVRRLLNGSAGNRGLVGSSNPSAPTGTQAGRPLAYTNEPFKDGTVVPLGEIVLAGLHLYPQLYRGDMSPADGAAVVLELARWLEANRVHPFYDGARIGSDQRDGAYFTAERIPGVFTPMTIAAFSRTITLSMQREFTKANLRAHYTHLAAAA